MQFQQPLLCLSLCVATRAKYPTVTAIAQKPGRSPVSPTWLRFNAGLLFPVSLFVSNQHLQHSLHRNARAICSVVRRRSQGRTRFQSGRVAAISRSCKAIQKPRLQGGYTSYRRGPGMTFFDRQTGAWAHVVTAVSDTLTGLSFIPPDGLARRYVARVDQSRSLEKGTAVKRTRVPGV